MTVDDPVAAVEQNREGWEKLADSDFATAPVAEALLELYDEGRLAKFSGDEAEADDASADRPAEHEWRLGGGGSDA